MDSEPRDRAVECRDEIRVSFPAERGRLTAVLATIRQKGGRLFGHLVYRLDEDMVAFFVCEKPHEAMLELREQGLEPEGEAIVLVRAEDRPGALAHLVRSLEAEGVEIGYTYAASAAGEIRAVFRTQDNPRAQDVLENYLLRPYPSPKRSS